MMKVMLLHGAFLLPVIALLITAAVYLTMITFEMSKVDRDATLDRLYKETLSYTVAVWGLLLVVILGLTVGTVVLELSHKVYGTVMAVVGIIIAVALGGMSFIGNQKLELYLQMKIPEYYNASILSMVAGGLLVLYGLLVMQLGYGGELTEGDISVRSPSRKMLSPGKPLDSPEEAAPLGGGEAEAKRESVKSLVDAVLSKYKSSASRRASRKTA